MKKLIIICFALISVLWNPTTFAANHSVPTITGKISLMDIKADAGKIYFTCAVEEEEKQIHFFVFEQNSWNEIPLPADTKAGGYLELQIFNGVPFILFSNNYGLTLIRYEQGTWYHVGKPNFSADLAGASSLNYIMKDGTPYIICENYATKKIDITMLETNGNLQIWTSPDATSLIPENVEQPFICMDLNKSVYTTWLDRKNEKIQVSKLINDDEQFQDISKGIPAKNIANLLSFVAIGNKLYLAYEDKSRQYAITIQCFNEQDAKWEILTTPASMNGKSFLFAENKSVYMLDASSKPVSFTYENNGWNEPLSLHSDVASSLKICWDGTQVYSAFLDSKNKLILQVN